MTARISRPAKTATQSGPANARSWLLEFMPESAREVEPLMGWTSSGDTLAQVKLWFATQEEAVAYAKRNGIAYRLETPAPQTRRVVAYSDNFKSSRLGQWTH